ncbi:MAG: nickel pincer cofactor biosynthesis protein LarC [Clostridia bacterium]|nr:nickel pincer cofactor biosynthesis protein LarC [Clostridia bacterium]
MTVAYFDCFSGISGNMILASFIEAGLDIEELKANLKTLPVGGYEIEVKDVVKQGIKAKHLEVKVLEKQPHRHLHHITEIIQQSKLPEEVKDLAMRIFTRLAEAEAHVHGTSVEKVHFHEVGAVDAIIDIVGAAYGVYKLGINKVYSSPLNVGQGMIKCAHGLMPVPAPATQELLKDAVSYSNEVEGELVTPTGAAILTTLTEYFGKQPLLKIKKVAYGAGTKDLPIPNVLRLILAEEKQSSQYLTDKAVVIETNIDDMNPEFYDYLMDKLFSVGAVDVSLIPVQMKKNRPGTLLKITSNQEDYSLILDVLFKETTTLGVRIYSVDRVKLYREEGLVATPWGKVRVKLGKKGEEIVNIKPEYEDCKAIAQKNLIPLKKVWQEVLSNCHNLSIKN